MYVPDNLRRRCAPLSPSFASHTKKIDFNLSTMRPVASHPRFCDRSLAPPSLRSFVRSSSRLLSTRSLTFHLCNFLIPLCKKKWTTNTRARNALESFANYVCDRRSSSRQTDTIYKEKRIFSRKFIARNANGRENR